MFALFGLVPSARHQTVRARYASVRALFHGTETGDLEARKKRFGRANRHARLLFARLLLVNQQTIGEVEQPTGPPIYERTEDTAAVMSWIEGGRPALLLAGDSGNGKSTIARESLRWFRNASSPTAVCVVDLSSPYTFMSSVGEYVDPAPISFNEAQSALVAHCKQMPRDGIVLIDNAPDWKSIETAFYWAPRCLITAEKMLVPSDLDHQTLEIGPLPEEVGSQLVRWFRPDADAGDIRRFLSSVGSKPRIIIDCLGMFHADEMSLVEISDCIEEERARLIQTAGTGIRAVHKLYERYFDELEADDPLTALLLSTISHFGQPVVRSELIVKVLIALANIREVYGIPTVAAAKVCLKVLRTRFLVSGRGDEIVTHGVTLNLFRDVTKTDAEDVAAAIIRSYVRGRGELLANLKLDFEMPPGMIEWIPGVARAIPRAPINAFMSVSGYECMALVYDCHTGLAQLGLFDRFISVLGRVLSSPALFTHIGDAGALVSCLRAGFKYGLFSRNAYADSLRAILSSSDQYQHHFREVVGCEIAEAEYDLVAWFQLHHHMETGNDREMISTLMIRGMVLDWLGYARLAQAAYLFPATRDSTKEFPRFIALECSVLGLITACKVDASDRIERWAELIGHHYSADDSSMESPPFHLDYLYRLAEAWIARTRVIARTTEANSAIDAFVLAARVAVKAGQRREALAAYIEAKSIYDWATVTAVVRKDTKDTGSFPEDHELEEVAASIDEPHQGDRLRLLAVLSAGLKSSFSRDDLETIAVTRERARIRGDTRTFKQAVLGEAVACSQLSIEMEHGRIDELHGVMTRAVDNLSSDEFRVWFTHFLRTQPQGVLLV